MKRSAVTFLIICSVFALAPRQASAQGGTWADRGYINVGWGVESGSSAQSSTVSKPIYGETGTLVSTATFTSGSLFDVGVGVRVFKNLTLGVAYHQEQNDTDGQLTGNIPSPVFFNRPRTLSSTVSGLDRKEMATHVNIGWVVPIGQKFDVMVYGGPSFFRLNQDSVTDVTLAEQGGNFTTVTAAPTITEVKKSVTGYNVGADATYIVWSNDSIRLGLGGFFRFAKASTEVQMLGTTTQPTDVGGSQYGLGVRLRF